MTRRSSQLKARWIVSTAVAVIVPSPFARNKSGHIQPWLLMGSQRSGRPLAHRQEVARSSLLGSCLSRQRSELAHRLLVVANAEFVVRAELTWRIDSATQAAGVEFDCLADEFDGTVTGRSSPLRDEDYRNHIARAVTISSRDPLASPKDIPQTANQGNTRTASQPGGRHPLIQGARITSSDYATRTSHKRRGTLPLAPKKITLEVALGGRE